MSPQVKLNDAIDQALPSLVAIYKQIHASPELSHQEAKTSALLARQLRSLGYEVTEHIGKYPNPDWKGYGVVALLKNGAGPTVLVRAEMDALPIEEQTGLPYASRMRVNDDSGREVPVMHACGHDIHVTTLIGTARMLAELKNQWRGTLILIGQPAEETLDGAKAMVADGLYARFPKPDYALTLHDGPYLEAGKVQYISGYSYASATEVEVVIRGRGGHSARPEASKDPIVLAAEFIMAIQTIVSRENSPFDPAVVTVGTIHGGTKSNVIPDEVRLQLTVRAFKEEVRQRILTSLERIANAVALAGAVPENRAPIVRVTSANPAMYNDPALVARELAALQRVLGAENVVERSPLMASDDFVHFGLEEPGIPIMSFTVGAIDADRMANSRNTGVPLPPVHSSLFWPIPEPTIRTGMKAMTAAVLDLMENT